MEDPINAAEFMSWYAHAMQDNVLRQLFYEIYTADRQAKRGVPTKIRIMVASAEDGLDKTIRESKPLPISNDDLISMHRYLHSPDFNTDQMRRDLFP